MRVLVVGGSGYVGRLVLPLLPDRFHLRNFDRTPPPWLDSHTPTLPHSHITGDVTDPAALRQAAEGMDLLLYMAMGRVGDIDIENATAAYDVNVKGVHLALDAALHAGIRRAVYTSSLSVYDRHLDIRSGVTDSEEVPAEPRSVYGFTKLLGEEVCRYFHRTHGLPSIALRLFHPVSVEDWHAQRPSDPTTPFCHTAAPDLARALTAALELDHAGFEIIHLTGDTTGRAYRHEKAQRLLNWQPEEGR